MDSHFPRLALIFVAATAVLAALLGNTPVFSFPVALFIAANVAAAFVATLDLRRMNQAGAGQGRLRTGLFAGAVVGLIAATALVAPNFIEGLEPETRLSVQLLILCTGFASALLTWWGQVHLHSGAEDSGGKDTDSASEPDYTSSA